MASDDDILAAREERKAAAAKAKEDQRRADLLVLDALERERGDENVYAVWTAGGLVVIRRPTRPEIERWRSVTHSDKANGQAKAESACALAKACVIHPSRETYAAMLQDYAGADGPVAVAAIRAAGEMEEEEAGKS